MKPELHPLKFVIIKKGLTQRLVALRLGMTESHLSAILTGYAEMKPEEEQAIREVIERLSPSVTQGD